MHCTLLRILTTKQIEERQTRETRHTMIDNLFPLGDGWQRRNVRKNNLSFILTSRPFRESRLLLPTDRSFSVFSVYLLCVVFYCARWNSGIGQTGGTSKGWVDNRELGRKLIYNGLASIESLIYGPGTSDREWVDGLCVWHGRVYWPTTGWDWEIFEWIVCWWIKFQLIWLKNHHVNAKYLFAHFSEHPSSWQWFVKHLAMVVSSRNCDACWTIGRSPACLLYLASCCVVNDRPTF